MGGTRGGEPDEEEIMEIQGKVVVITGGAQGIGRAIAERFGAAGAKLVLGDVQETVLEAAVAELRAKGYEVHGVAGNIAQEADAEQLMAEAGRHFGRLDVAVLNAGILRDGLLVRVDKETGAVTGKMTIW